MRGALEQASWKVTCTWEKDPLAAAAAGGAADGMPQLAAAWSMRLTLIGAVAEHYPFSD